MGYVVSTSSIGIGELFYHCACRKALFSKGMEWGSGVKEIFSTNGSSNKPMWIRAKFLQDFVKILKPRNWYIRFSGLFLDIYTFFYYKRKFLRTITIEAFLSFRPPRHCC